MTADKKGKKRPEVKICRECKYFNIAKAFGGFPVNCLCCSESAPITNFVYSLKEVHKINTDGCCAHYEPKGMR